MPDSFLLSPGGTRFRTMNTSLAPSALGPGEFALATNIRPDDFSLTTRWPTVDLSATGIGSPNAFRGAYSCTINGTAWLFAAYRYASDGLIRILQSSNGTSWAESTATSGAYGNTRLADGGVNCTFAVVYSKWRDGEVLVVQNGDGTSNPIVIEPAQSIITAWHGQVSAPVAVLNMQSVPYVPNTSSANYFAFASSGTAGLAADYAFATTNATYLTANFNTITTTDGAGTSKVQSAGILITPKSGVVIGDNCTATYTPSGGRSAPNFHGPAQLIMLHTWAAYNIWKYLKLEIWDATASAWTILWDPATPDNYAPPIQTSFNDTALTLGTTATGNYNGAAMTAFALNNIPSGNSTTKIRWTWATAQTGFFDATGILFYGIFSSGSLPYGYSFMIANASSRGLTESPGVTIPASVGLTMRLSDVGGAKDGCGLMTIPYAPGVFYNYHVPVQNSTTTELNEGVDTTNIYIQEFGGSDFFFGNAYAFGTYGGSWSFPGGTTSGSSYVRSLSTNVVIDISRYAPDAYALCCQPGTTMAAASSRLFVGNGKKMWFSEYGAPFRFRQFLSIVDGQPIARSAASVQLPNETVAGFATPAASGLGATSVFMFTDKSTYEVSGFDGFSLSRPSLMASTGCSMPWTIAQYKDAIFFVDDNYQLRRMNAMANGTAQLMNPISRQVVDDQLKNIPAARRAFAWGLAIYDRYYLCYTLPAGTSNTRILVWDETVGSFVQDTVTTIESLVRFGSRLIGFGSNYLVYEHEQVGTTTGQTVTLTTGELNENMWTWALVGRIGVVCDKQTGQSLSITKTARNGPAQVYGGLDTSSQYTVASDKRLIQTTTLDMGSNIKDSVIRYDHYTDDSSNQYQGGIVGIGVQISLTGTFTPGTKIYALVAEVAPSDPKADA